MTTAAMEKSEEVLRREIEELHRQQREITQRIRDPRGLRRGGLAPGGPRNIGPALGRQRGIVRPADRPDSNDEPQPKRRLSSAVVKVEEGEFVEAADASPEVVKRDETLVGTGGAAAVTNGTDQRSFGPRQSSFSSRNDDNRRTPKDFDYQAAVPVPRVLPKNEDPSLIKRNKRMFGILSGTLEKFVKEDMKLSGTEAYMRRSSSLLKAEQRAREESERLRQLEREKIVENRKRDLILRARVAAKAEEKKLELLFLQWSEHHKRLSGFLRTKTEPHIYYMPVKPLEADPSLIEKRREEAFLEWKAARREELSEYQKQLTEQYVANVEREIERRQNARNNRKPNDIDLQENMDKELDTHRLEHGPKKRSIPGSNTNAEEEEDVEDINVGEDDLMDDVLVGVDESSRGVDDGHDAVQPEGGDGASVNGHEEQLE